jgi:PAS domain S-box-containing protein
VTTRLRLLIIVPAIVAAAAAGLRAQASTRSLTTVRSMAGPALPARALAGALAVLAAGGLIFIAGRSRQRARALRTALARLDAHEQVLSHVTDAIVVADGAGCVTSWSTGAETLFGVDRARAVGRPLTELVTDRMARRRGGDLHEALGTRVEWRGDAEIVRPSGDVLFIEASIRRFEPGGGGDAGLMLVARDVDARRRAEIEAGARARQQAAVAVLGQRALAGVDLQRLIVEATSLAAATLQVHASAMFELVDEGQALLLRAGDGWSHARVGETALAASASSYPGSVLSADARVLALDSADAGTTVVDGLLMREGFVAGAAAAVPAPAGIHGVLLVADRRLRRFSRDDLHFLQALSNVVGAAVDRAAIDASLRCELALHTATLEAVADGILVTDRTGTVRRYNQRMVALWGLPPSLLEQPRAEEWVRWCLGQCENTDAQLDAFRATAWSGAPQHVTMPLKDGRVIEWHSYPQRLDGALDGRVWSFRDITERIRAEEERRRLEAQMQHVQKLESLGVLAGGIAHDFNNLLVGILGQAGLALAELEPESALHDRLTQIQRSAQHAADLTNQMLAYSGKGRFVLQSSDLSEIVGELTHLLRASVSKSAEIVLDLHPSLPAFEGDSVQIRQVIMNLITNASDAIGETGGTIVVQTGQMRATREYLADAWIGADQPEGTYVFAEVQDTGCGMDAATLARIFDPFFSTKFTGRGLGLAAVLGIVRGHHGAIKIASQPGAGTTFRVLLPATQAAVAPVTLPAPTATRAASGARVLVVDDEAGVRTVARESLKRAGFEVVTANDGVEALEVLEQQEGRFDAVLLDLTMPRMSGVEAFSLIKGRHPQLHVVLTSGYSAHDVSARCGSDDIAGFVQKPFMPAVLVRTMLEVLTPRQAREVA